MQNVFPFTVYAEDTGNYVINPSISLVEEVVKEVKLRKESWYTFDVEVTGARSCIIHVKGMRSPVYGGIGHTKFSFTLEDTDKVREVVEKHILRRAKWEYEQQKEQEERRIIQCIADKVLSTIYS